MMPTDSTNDIHALENLTEDDMTTVKPARDNGRDKLEMEVS
jgi:hypothetical protein